MAFLGAWWSLPSSVRASEEAPAVYDVPDGCPGPEVFASEVAKRRGTGMQPRGLRVTVTNVAMSGYRGRLHLEGGRRDVEASTCEEVVQALALAAAMAEGEKSEEQGPAPLPTEPMPVREQAPVKKRPEAQHGVRPSVGLAFGGTSAVGKIAPTLELFGGLDWKGPSARLTASTTRSDIPTLTGTARFERWAVHVDGCPLGLRASSLQVAPCAGLEGGVLVGSGVSILNAESSSLVWLAIVTGARVSWGVSHGVFFEAEGRAVIPLLLHTFFVRPNETVFRTPGLAAEGVLGVGYRFSK